MDPREDVSEIDIDEAIGEALRTLPQPVRAFVTGNERDQIVRELVAKYSLRVDQGGEFERVLILMLLGVISPEEFTEMLREAGLPISTINELAAEVNNRIFIPLRLAQTNEQHYQPAVSQKPEPIPPPAIPYTPPQTLPGSPVPVPTSPVPSAPPPPAANAPYTPPTAQPTPQQAEPQPFVPVQPMPPSNGYSWHPAAAVHIFTPNYAVPYPGQPQPIAAGAPAQQMYPLHTPANPEYPPVSAAPYPAPSAPAAPQVPTPPSAAPTAPEQLRETPSSAPLSFTPPPIPPAPAMPPLQSFARVPELPQNPPTRTYSSDPYRESV